MYKIAITDDNLVFRRITKILLKKMGVFEEDILLFKNGKEIYDYINQNNTKVDVLPNLIFLDLNMPIMNGWEFIKKCQLFSKEFNYQPKIYIISSSVDSKDYDKSKNIKIIKGYLIKPITTDALSEIIKINLNY